VDLGIAITQDWDEPAKSIKRLERFIRASEDHGFHSLWVQEQLIGHDPSYEPLATLAFAAGLTSRIRLAAAGFVAPLRPTLGLAKALATVDQMSLGRLDVGLVLGEMRSAYEAGDVRWETRAARLEDAIVLLRKLWSGPTDHKSEFGVYRGTVITPLPVQPGGPPIWIGAKRGRALERVARSADGWVGAGGMSLSDWRIAFSELRALCEQYGRPTPPAAKKLYLWLDRDESVAFDKLASWFTKHWNAGVHGGDMARSLGVWGDPRRCVDVVAEMAAAGAGLAIMNPVGDTERQLALIAEHVMPAVAAL
jgi:alkanesulfonate monooxygenase SsuD/methylene tetrahydromethanopterin reductase-like flavin-dependent oxidoreductase (luciferase family)